MNLNLIKIVGVAVGVAGMTVETRAAEMQEYPNGTILRSVCGRAIGPKNVCSLPKP